GCDADSAGILGPLYGYASYHWSPKRAEPARVRHGILGTPCASPPSLRSSSRCRSRAPFTACTERPPCSAACSCVSPRTKASRGGATSTRPRAPRSRPPSTSTTAAREATEWLRRGFATAKIKVSGTGSEGVARVAAVRAAVGDGMGLRVDFNESLELAESVAFIRQLEPYALTLVEQPIARTDLAG